MAKHEEYDRGAQWRKSRRFSPYLENITFLGCNFDDVIVKYERLGTSIIFGSSVMVDRNTA